MTKRPYFWVFLFSVFAARSPVGLPAQAIDYRTEESPCISWNGVPLHDARLLALAGISAMASPAFALSAHPGLIPGPHGLNAGITFGGANHESYQYWGVNQGVVQELDGVSGDVFRCSGLAASLRLEPITFSAGWFMGARLEFPSFHFLQEFTQESWSYSGEFDGVENDFFLALAGRWGGRLSLGLTWHHVSGHRVVEIDDTTRFVFGDQWEFNRTRHSESHRLAYERLSLGVRWRFVGSWILDAAWHQPFTGEVRRSVVREFYSSLSGERLTIQSHEYVDDLVRPAKFVLGVSHGSFYPEDRETGVLGIALEAVYTFWDEYRYEFFGEDQSREMRNTVSLAAAAEYGVAVSSRQLVFRIGYRWDPQPLETPPTVLHGVSGGVGLEFGRFSLGVGVAYHFCRINGTTQDHLLLAATLNARIGRDQ